MDPEATEKPRQTHLVTLEFRWMPRCRDRRSLHSSDEIDWERESQEGSRVIDRLHQDPAEERQTFDVGHDHPVLIDEGETCAIAFTDEEDAKKFRSMVELQWMMINIAAMIGTAGVPGRLPEDIFDDWYRGDEEDDEDDDEDQGDDDEDDDINAD